MRYKVFGRRTGLRVSEYVLGTANFGSSVSSAGLAGSKEIFDAFTAAGGTTFDVSNIYQKGEAEAVLGGLLGQDREEYVIIAKYGGTRGEQVHPGAAGNSRKTMVRSLERTLKSLNTDYVDVFMPHFPDGLTPTVEILDALEGLVQAGKVRYAGLSNFPAWRIAGAATRSELNGRVPLAGFQSEFSLVERSAERELIPMAEAHGLGMLAYSPLAGGLLTGKYRLGESGRLSGQREAAENESAGRDRSESILDALLAVANEAETGPVQTALAWLRHRAERARTALIPIVGPRTPAHLEGYLAALDVNLGSEHYEMLDRASGIRLGAPHEAVAAALEHGSDGDRDQLDVPIVPVT